MLFFFSFQILKESDDSVFVTYPGWDSKYNAWIPKTNCADVINVPYTSTSLPDRQHLFCANLRLDIKRQLRCRRKEDPQTIIVQDIQLDVYNKLFGTRHRKIKYSKNSELNNILGKSWMERFNNSHECCYVIQGTATISLHKHRPICEFDSTGKEIINCLGHFVKFQFVRGDATEQNVKDQGPDNFSWRD